jgi:hypothetical protein
VPHPHSTGVASGNHRLGEETADVTISPGAVRRFYPSAVGLAPSATVMRFRASVKKASTLSGPASPSSRIGRAAPNGWFQKGPSCGVGGPA